jgi:hypothetical protein
MDKDQIRDYELDIIVKAWRDEPFRKRLLNNPKQAIEKEFDITVPSEVQIFVHEENEYSLHLIVPSVPSNFNASDLSDDELRDVIGGVMATGHLGAFSNSQERVKIRKLKRENDELRKMMNKLQDDLSALEKQMLKK